jgi:hypothetical protein
MKLWLLRPLGKYLEEDSPNYSKEDNPWVPWYDKAFGFVIRAETEKRARKIAQAHGGDEIDEWKREGKIGEWKCGKQPTWLDVRYSTCTELTADGPEELIMEEFKAG